MSTSVFSGDIWTDEELLALLKKLEQMYAGGTRRAVFKDQQLEFGSTTELKERINDLRKELVDREALTTDGVATSSKSKKQVRITSRSRGF
ncbi:MAG TPA: hypothetical protein ENI25_03730 [Epsilonproteobacteria bacterium]|nr:hypothetical protein [Campylobacterota bacterium]